MESETNGISDTTVTSLEWQRLSKLSREVLPGLLGRCANFLVQPYGGAVSVEGGLLSRAYLVSFQDGVSAPKQNVVLRLRHSDWHLLEDISQPLRVIQAVCHDLQSDVIMDCTQQATVVVGSRALVQETSVQMAELFCGGFAGWTQAAWVLHKHGIPVSTRWTLDIDEDCHNMLQLQAPSLEIIRSFEELEGLDEGTSQVHVDSSIEWDWWLHCFAKWPINMLVASPPGQPWNHTEQASGLDSADGRLLLRVLDIASAFQVPVVGLELSMGFFRHPHYNRVVAAWQAAGYKLHWQAPLNLLDVLPCARPRCFVVLHLQVIAGEPSHSSSNWVSSKRANLREARAIFDHPPSLHASLILSAEELAVYMDPWYMPPTRSVQHRQSPAMFRLRNDMQSAGCFLPQYQKQHYMPESTLARQGLLGFLLQHQDAIRFFSGAEIASLHGVVRPLLLRTSGDSQMKLLGGSSAVPQTIACLTHACQALGLEGLPAPEAAVNLALAERLHNGNSLFLPAGADWVLCRKDQVCEVLETGFQFQEVPGAKSAAHEFVTWTLQCGAECTQLCIPAGANPQLVLSFTGLQPIHLPRPLAKSAQSMTLSVAHSPVLTCGGFRGCTSHESALCIFATAQRLYLVDVQSPRLWPQLLNIFDDLGGAQDDLACFSACGQRLWQAEEFEGCVVAETLTHESPDLSLRLLHDAFPRTELHASGEALHIRCPEEVAVQFWLGFPFHLTEALGWATTVVNFPCHNRDPMELHLRPSPGRLHVCPGLLPSQLRLWYMVAKLEAHSLPAASAANFQVELQVVARRFWHGYLPGDFRIDVLEDWWREASAACDLPPDVRVFSGPHPLLPDTSVGQARQIAKGVVVRRTGALLLTLHPSCVGGGVKEENMNWSKTRLASLCLAQGVDLQSTTDFVDAISSLSSANKLFQGLSSGSEGSRWVAKAEVRSRRLASRKKQELRSSIRASEVSIATGFFQNDDGTDALILDCLRPGATGVLLTDGPQAVELLHTMQGVQPDELALLVLGHDCPCPADGCHNLSFPAVGRRCGSPLLLAGCLHNLGGKKVSPKKQQNVTVDLPDVVCCTFVVYADDCDPEQWKAFAASPVKSVVAAFSGCAADKALSEPWGRRYLAKGKASAPAVADQILFQARVDKKNCDILLAASCHNCVYMIPKNQDQSLKQGYSVVWLGSSRAEAVKASLQVQGQLGLVRSKDRYGLRVPDARHGAVFQQLRPGQAVPTKVTVSKLFKMGPVPAGADAISVEKWATGGGWSVKVLKALGPQHWLLGSNTEPPVAYPAFNGQTVLVSKVQQRSNPAPMVQSGQLQSRPLPGPAASSHQGEDPWNHSDPWSSALSSFSCRASITSATSSQAPRQVAGPTEQRFQQQDSRIQALEDSVKQLSLKQDQNHAQLLHQQGEDRAAAQTAVSGLKEQLAVLGTEVSKQLQTSVESLQAAQTQHQQQMQSGLDELKALFLASRDSRDPNKKAKIHEQEDL
ncbi:hypothetical protein AK812_SmicGene21382 [Symbiodinium microadriaticum]|uniref:Uncharacterized protein n=1 Tax=Symbiodinium microadriaticum TaxID=2951 RepID=A0A1Q9DMM9_SYMMI|nr:hypothetical protein AK812_SmicGene21382 [Symbiodinium microadriaticum]